MLLADIFAQVVEKEASTKIIPQIIAVERAIARNPCILLKIASYLNVISIPLVISKQFIGIADSLKPCRGGTIRTSVVLMDRDGFQSS